jgi:hypothetical protein
MCGRLCVRQKVDEMSKYRLGLFYNWTNLLHSWQSPYFLCLNQWHPWFLSLYTVPGLETPNWFPPPSFCLEFCFEWLMYVDFKAQCTSESSGSFLRTCLLGSFPGFDSVGLRWGSRICLSYHIPSWGRIRSPVLDNRIPQGTWAHLLPVTLMFLTLDFLVLRMKQTNLLFGTSQGLFWE